MLRKRIGFILLAGALALCLGACGRADKYAGSLRVGTTRLPKNLNPYASMENSAAFFVGLFYDTLLGSASVPADYVAGEKYTFPDGAVYEPVDRNRNPLAFADGLVEVEGAFEKQEGSVYGYEFFDPTEEQWLEQCQRESIVFGFDEGGNPIEESEEEFLARALIAVPKTGWMRFRFKVVEGRSWSDGTPFTAEDIKFTFDYIKKHAGSLGSQAYFLTDYYGSEVVDGDFVFTLASSNYTAMKTICNSIVIIPKHLWQSVRDPAREKNLNPVGTGAYRIAEGDYIEGSSITATLRDDYDEKLLAQMFAGDPIGAVSVILMSNEDVLISALNEGNVDLMLDSVTSSKAYAVENNSAYANVKVSAVPSETVTTLLFNVGPYGAFREGSFEGYSYDIRRAISLCIDQEALIDEVLHGKGVPVGDGLVQDYFAHAWVGEDGGYVHHRTNVKEANAILDATPFQKDESGSRGLTFSIFATPDNEVAVKAIASQLEQIGIAIEYDQATAAYSEEIKQQNHADFDMIINRVTFNADKLLMFNARYGVYPATGSVRLFNYSGLIDHTLNAMMNEMELTPDTAAQYELCRQVQAYLAGLAIEIPLYSENTITFYSAQKWDGWIEAEGESVWNRYSIRYLQRRAA